MSRVQAGRWGPERLNSAERGTAPDQGGRLGSKDVEVELPILLAGGDIHALNVA